MNVNLNQPMANKGKFITLIEMVTLTFHIILVEMTHFFQKKPP